MLQKWIYSPGEVDQAATQFHWVTYAHGQRPIEKLSIHDILQAITPNQLWAVILVFVTILAVAFSVGRASWSYKINVANIEKFSLEASLKLAEEKSRILDARIQLISTCIRQKNDELSQAIVNLNKTKDFYSKLLSRLAKVTSESSKSADNTETDRRVAELIQIIIEEADAFSFRGK
jgi:hypothetical protein